MLRHVTIRLAAFAFWAFMLSYVHWSFPVITMGIWTLMLFGHIFDAKRTVDNYRIEEQVHRNAMEWTREQERRH